MATYMHTHTHTHTAHTCPQKQNSRARVRAAGSAPALACSAQAAWQTLAPLLLALPPPARAVCMVFPRKLLRARAFARDSAQPTAAAAAAAAAAATAEARMDGSAAGNVSEPSGVNESFGGGNGPQEVLAGKS